MSAFLGPIHHWLFNKICLQEQLEINIVEAFKETFGDDINRISVAASENYGSPIGNIPLENQIALSAIHPWLQNAIRKGETRLAYIIGEALKQYGPKAFEIALKQFEFQGSLCGKEAASKGSVSAPQIYKALNDYLLEGMPCDRVNIITENTDELLAWNTTQCLHRGNWESAYADIDSLYKLRFQWIKAFVESANPKYEFTVKNGNTIDYIFINEIHLKNI